MSLNLFNRDYSLSLSLLLVSHSTVYKCLWCFTFSHHVMPYVPATCFGFSLFVSCVVNYPHLDFCLFVLISFHYTNIFIALFIHIVLYSFVRSFVACRFYDEKFTRPRTNEIKSKRYLSFGIANQQMDGLDEWMKEGMDERVNVIQHNQQLNWYLTCFKIIIIKSIVNNRITINATLFK